ncbi:MAG: hypothetical protein OEM89_07810, partial [Nitrosopumilus sp.]|nr:hypothetical protein [Nitrosopumilus sp.]
PNDNDNDGVPDGEDQCPGADDTIDNNNNQIPDCLEDSDGDGVPDGEDQCPGEDDTLDTDADGIPDCLDDFPNDNDNDGVPDGEDQCPGADDTIDNNNNQIPDCLEDSDGDGVANDEDPDDNDPCVPDDQHPLCVVETSDNDGGDNQWDTRPTFGINHETRETVMVENGFTFNGQAFSISDNHHTPFTEESINIGTVNTFAATVYADKGLKIQEFLFGVPGIGLGHQAEMRVEVWYDNEGEIEDVKVVQQSEVIDMSSVSITHQKTLCTEKAVEEKCDQTKLSAIFLEPLKDRVMAIKAIDFKFRDQTTYLNEGFEVSGKSLNPMESKLIPSNIRNEGLVKVTQTEKYSNQWISEDGKIFEMNDFGSFKQVNQTFERFQDTGEPRTRLHSGFGGILQLEKSKALEIFNSTKFISELPDSYGYYYESDERINNEIHDQMLIQEQKAQEWLDIMYRQARH